MNAKADEKWMNASEVKISLSNLSPFLPPRASGKKLSRKKFCNGTKITNSGEFFMTLKCFFCCVLNLCILSLPCLKLHSLAYFIGKSVVLNLLEGRELSAHYWEDWEEKSQAPSRIRTHNLSVTRHALYCCASTATHDIECSRDNRAGCEVSG